MHKILLDCSLSLSGPKPKTTGSIFVRPMSDVQGSSNATNDEKEPPNKKFKSDDEAEMVEQAPDSEWPEAWLMPEGECANQKAPNKLDPNVPVKVEELKALGIW